MSVFSILGRSFRSVSAHVCVLNFGKIFSQRQCSCLCSQFWGDLFVASVLMSVFSVCACQPSCSTLPALSCTATVISLFLRLRNLPYTSVLYSTLWACPVNIYEVMSPRQPRSKARLNIIIRSAGNCADDDLCTLSRRFCTSRPLLSNSLRSVAQLR